MFRQVVISAFVIGSLLNAAIVVGAAGGYKFYANVLPLDAAGAERFGLYVEVALILLAVVAWILSPRSRGEEKA